GLAIDQIAQSGLSSLSVIYYSAQLFSLKTSIKTITYLSDIGCLEIHGASLQIEMCLAITIDAARLKPELFDLPGQHLVCLVTL
ncbi:hypothetical protein NL441_24940, partial [Klebsiella pneumoniae]|nr:hypothetical protein [Klebsiella pneumoniae]